jgi:hypothetical protein
MKPKSIEPDALYWASLNNLQFLVPGKALLDICKSGRNDDDVAVHVDEVRRLAEDLYQDDPKNPWRPTAESIRKELKEYGSWSAEELADDESNWHRLLWLAAWDIFEDEDRDCSAPVAVAK